MVHKFHIPVLGLGYSIDTPLKVARYGISSVVSVVDDELIERMRKYKISQIPVIDINGFVGSVDETDLFQSYVSDKNAGDKPIREVMGKAYPMVKLGTSIEEVSKLFTRENAAVLVDLGNGKHHIITKHDIISSIK